MKILISGTNGLVGREVLRVLLKEDTWSTSRQQASDLTENHICMDLAEDRLEEKIGGNRFDCIVHCAAQIPPGLTGTAEIADINSRMDRKIIDYCAENHIKLIYMSSTAVYGMNHKGKIKEKGFLNPDASEYAMAKRRTEIEIEKRCDQYHIFRISSPYGILQKNRNVLKIFISNAIHNQPICYHGSGSRTQNFTYNTDIALAVDKAIKSSKSGIYNIASERSVSMKELAGIIAQETERIFKYQIPVKASGQTDSQENVRMDIDISSAQKELDWIPIYSIEKGIRALLQAEKERI